jgi:transposase
MRASRRKVLSALLAISTDPDFLAQAWLADVLARIADTPQTKLAELLPWNWATELILPRAA